LLDLSSYEKFYAGELQDYSYPEEAIAEATRHLPTV
jgi:tryptophan synthase beta chain